MGVVRKRSGEGAGFGGDFIQAGGLGKLGGL